MSECYLITNAISSWRCDPPDTNIKALSLNYEQAVDLINTALQHLPVKTPSIRKALSIPN
jgi:hypothetical protein